MKAQLVILFQVLQEKQNEIVISYFFLAALTWQYWVTKRPIFTSILIGTAALLAILTILAYFSTIILYLLYPNYIDHIQPQVASISWLLMQGHELYPDWTSSDVYGLAYGPILFLINGTALLLNPSIFASKLPGVLSLGTAMGVTYTLFNRTTASNLMSICL